MIKHLQHYLSTATLLRNTSSLKLWVFLLVLGSYSKINGQSTTGTAAQFRTHIQYLASEELAGRLTDSEGERKAADYIAAYFKQAGLVPAGPNGSYFHTFTFEKHRMASIQNGMELSGSFLPDGTSGKALLKAYTHFYPMSASCDTAKQSNLPMQAVGFGYRDEDLASFDTLTGLAIVKLGLPEGVGAHSQDALLADLSKRIRFLQSKGAKAILFTKPQSGFEDIPKKEIRARVQRTAIPVMFADTTYSFITQFKFASYDYTIHSIQGTGTNVVARTPGKKKAPLIVGAHYDHIGRGELGGSRSKTEGIHYGADDNASGTAMIMEMAASLKAKKIKKHTVYVVAFSGEELGLIGSGKFVEFMGAELDNARAMFNFDMVGRVKPNEPKLLLGGTGTCLTWNDILNSAEDYTTLNVERNPSGTGASDHTNFYYRKIPVLSFFTGLHNEYHTPQDVDSLIQYEGMELVYNYAMTLLQLMQNKKYVKGSFQSVKEPEKKSASFSVSMGVMPDYGYTGKGLKITGANPGGAAEKAGLEAGDVITKIGEHTISDIYNYMEVLRLFKKGDQTTVGFERNGKSETRNISFN
jgi:aminopeptidase YwaD